MLITCWFFTGQTKSNIRVLQRC